MSDPVDQQRRYFDAQADKYDDYTTGDAWTPNVYLVDVLHEQIADPAAVRSVLDLGTGTGQTLLAVDSVFPSANLYGVDVSPGMLAIAAGKLPRAELAAADVSSYAHGLDRTFDLMTMIGCAELVPDLPEVVDALTRHLNPGGLLVLTIEPLVDGLGHELDEIEMGERRRYPWNVADVVNAAPTARLVTSRLFTAYRRLEQDVLYELLALRV